MRNKKLKAEIKAIKERMVFRQKDFNIVESEPEDYIHYIKLKAYLDGLTFALE